MEFESPCLKQVKKVIQPKLHIGEPNDKYEQEADAVANRVMQTTNDANFVQRKCADCEEELQMKPISSSIRPLVQKASESNPHIASQDLSRSLSASKGGGKTLDSSTQSFMGNSIGADFSAVKIHTDSTAVQMNRQLHSRAFTYGSDIYFGHGQYNPQSSKGKRLLAHELTHVVQQGKGNLSIQGDWQEDADQYYEDAVKHYEEIKKKGAEAMEAAERKKDQLYKDGKEFIERAKGYGERKLGEAEELYHEGKERMSELGEEVAEDARGWWNSGSGDVTKIEFDGSQVRVLGSDPYTAPAISGLKPGHKNIAAAGLPPNTNYTTPQYQHIKGVGPIPWGNYYVNPAEAESNPPSSFPVGGWGKYRTRLHERTATYIKRRATMERDGGFFIHEDADKNGTAGCIGFQNNKDNFEVYKRIKNNSAQIPVEVRYPAPVMAPGTGPSEETG